MADQVLKLFRQSWWAADRDLEGTLRVLEGSTFTLGFVDEENNLIAFARVVSDGRYKATIYDVLVEKHMHGTGLGKALMDALINDVSLLQVKHVELYCLPEMIPFYQRLGFETIEPQVHLLRKSQIDK